MDPPLPSYLHRVDDRGILLSYQAMENLARQWDISDQLISAHPDDLYQRILFLDALIKKGDREALREGIEDLRERVAVTGDPIHQFEFRIIQLALYSLDLSAEGRNAFDLIKQITDPSTSLKQRIHLLADFLDYDEYMPPFTVIASPSVPDFMDLQTTVKIMRVMAVFSMLQGEREEALQILAASYRIGQLMEQAGNIHLLMGVALRGVASDGFEIYLLNACEIPEDFDKLNAMLRMLNNKNLEITEENIEKFNAPFSREWRGTGEYSHS